MWPKSTLDGVRSAISSRKVLSPSMQIRFERPADESMGSFVVEEFELSIPRPIGITIEGTNINPQIVLLINKFPYTYTRFTPF